MKKLILTLASLIYVNALPCADYCPLEPNIDLDGQSPGTWLVKYGKSVTSTEYPTECPAAEEPCYEFSHYVDPINHPEIGVAGGITLPFMEFYNFKPVNPFSDSGCCKYVVNYELSGVKWDDA